MIATLAPTALDAYFNIFGTQVSWYLDDLPLEDDKEYRCVIQCVCHGVSHSLEDFN
jgi:hypothetical protein